MHHQQHSISPSHPVLSLKLYSPTHHESHYSDDNDQYANLTIRQAFTLYVLPTLVADKVPQSTIDEYHNSIGHWERIMKEDPPLCELNDDVVDYFRQQCPSAGYSGATCNKWFRHLRAILNRMGPRLTHSKRSRRNRKYFAEVPFLEDLPEEHPDPIEMPERHIDCLYHAFDAATWPPKRKTGCEPRDWWRCSLVWLINYGPRRDDWRYLSRSNFDYVKNEFWFRAKKTKKFHYLVFNDAVLAHLALLPRDAELVFSPTRTNKQLYEHWHKLQQKAGIRRQDGKPYDFQDLRQTAASRYNDHMPGTAEMLLGHALPRETQVTAKSYLGKQRLKPLWKAIQSIKQPKSFQPVIDEWTARMASLTRFDPNQRQLF